MKGFFRNAIKRSATIFIVALIALLTTTTSVYAEQTYSDIVSDPNTMDTYQGKLLSDTEGSRYAGRIWSDKSVVSTDFENPNIVTLDMATDGYDKGNVTFNSSFGHIFSALASSQVVNEYPPSPIDLVITIDMSASMGQDTRFGLDGMNASKVDHNRGGDTDEVWPDGGVPMAERIANSRIQKTLDAINQTIDTLMAQNMQNRVSVVGYGANATVIVPLAHYRKVGDQPYLKVGGMETLYHPSDLMVHEDSSGELGWYWQNNRDTAYTVVLDAEKCDETTKITESSKWERITNSVSNNVNGGLQGVGVKAFPGVATQSPETLKASAEKYQTNAAQAANESPVQQNAKSKLAELVADTEQLEADDYVGYFTNTQGGIYLGLKQLADTSARVYSERLSTGEVSTVARVPAAIIMSDGGANFALNSMEQDVSHPEKLLSVRDYYARFCSFRESDGAYIDYAWDNVLEWNKVEDGKQKPLSEKSFTINVTGATAEDDLKFIYRTWDDAKGDFVWGSTWVDVSPSIQPDGSATYTLTPSLADGQYVGRVAVAIKKGLTVTSTGGSVYTTNGVLPDFCSVGQWYIGDDSYGSDETGQSAGRPGDYSHRLGVPNRGDEWWNVYLPGTDTLDTSQQEWEGLRGLSNPGADYFFDGTLCGAPSYSSTGVLYCDAAGELTGTTAPTISVVATAAYMRTVVDQHYKNGWQDDGASPDSQIPLSVFTMDVDSKHVPQWGRWRLYPSLDPSRFYPGDSGTWILDNVYYFGTSLGGSDWGMYGSYSTKDVLVPRVFTHNMQFFWNQFVGGKNTLGTDSLGAQSGATVTQGTYLNMVPLNMEPKGTTYYAGAADTITLTHEQVMANAKYNDGFYDASTDALSSVFSDILDLILGKVFVPVSGDNDAGVGDSLTYQDPIGEYMEIKNQSVSTTPWHTDEVLGLPETTYDMAVLLFGEMHGLIRGGTYDYDWNSQYLGAHSGSGSFQLGWYKGNPVEAEGPYTDFQAINSAKGTEYKSAVDAWADGWILRLDYKTLSAYVPIVNVEPGAQELPEQLRHTVYNIYQFSCTDEEKNKLRRNPVYGDVTPEIEDGWEQLRAQLGGTYPDNNDYYKEIAGVYRLNDIRVWTEDTGDYIDTSGALTPNAGYDLSLYVNIPAVAIPTQLAEITLGPDGPLAYETNLGSDHLSGVVDAKGNETTYEEFCYQSTPFRLFYGVGLADKLLVKDDAGNPVSVDFSAISSEYIASHTDADDKVYFLSNFYSNTPYEGYVSDTYDGARTRGDPTVAFSPSRDNRYYVFQKPLPLYAHAYEVSAGNIVPVDKTDPSLWGENTSGNGSTTWKDATPETTGGAAWQGGTYMGTYASKEAFDEAWAACGGTGTIEDSLGITYEVVPNGIIFLETDVMDDVSPAGQTLSSNDFYFLVVDYYLKGEGEGKDINGKTIPGSFSGTTAKRVVARRGSAFGSGYTSDAIQSGNMLCWTNMKDSWPQDFDYSSCVAAGDIQRGMPTREKLTLKGQLLKNYLSDTCQVSADQLDAQVAYWEAVQADENVTQRIKDFQGDDGVLDDGEFKQAFEWVLATRPGGIRTGDMSNNVQSKQPNKTDTSYNYYLPTVSDTSGTDDDVRLNLYLGNNGKIRIANNAVYLGKTIEVDPEDSKYSELIAKRFGFDIFIDGYEGDRTASRIAYNHWANGGQGGWQQQIDTLDVLVNNAGLLLNANSNPVIVDASGNVVDKIGPNTYCVYAGIDASDDDANVVNVFKQGAGLPDAGRTVYIPKGEAVPESHTDKGAYWTLYKTETDDHPAGSLEFWLKEAWLVPTDDIASGWSFDDAQIASGRYKHLGYGSSTAINDPTNIEYVDGVIPLHIANSQASTKGPKVTTTSELSLRTMFVTDTLTFSNGHAECELGNGEGLYFEGLDESVSYHLYEKMPLTNSFVLKSNTLIELDKEKLEVANHADDTAMGFDDETSTAQEGALFVNAYAPHTEVAPELQKEYRDKGSGKDIDIEEGQFSFTLTSDGNPMPEGDGVAMTDDTGKVTWPQITFTKEGTYTYTVRENDPNDGQVIWDEDSHTITVTVTRDEDYNLHATWTWDSSHEPEDAVITNLRESSVYLPNTGGKGINSFIFGGLAVCASAAVGYAVMHEKEEPKHIAHQRTRPPARREYRHVRKI